MSSALTVSKAAEEIIQQDAETLLLLARRMAMGETVSPPHVANVLKDNRASAGELDDLVGQLQHRNRLREKRAKKEAHESRKEVVRSELDKAGAVLNAAVAHHRQVTTDLREELRELTTLIAEAGCIDAQLSRTCPDKAMVAEFRNLEQPIYQASSLEHSARKAIETAQANLASCEPGLKEHYRKQVRRLEDRAGIAKENHRRLADRREELYVAMIEF